jgi:hypothetical protein
VPVALSSVVPISTSVFSPHHYRAPDAVSLLPGLTILGGAIAGLALMTEPMALLAGGPIATLAGALWMVNRARHVVVPWLVDRTVGHPLRAVPEVCSGALKPCRPDLGPWIWRPMDTVRWTPVLQGEHQGFAVAVGVGWVAVDLGAALPRLDVPLDRARFWADLLYAGGMDRPPAVLDTDRALWDFFGEDANGPLVSEPLAGLRRLDAVMRAQPTLGRATLLDGHLVLPMVQAGSPHVPARSVLDQAVATARDLVASLDTPWARTCRAQRLISSGTIRQGNRRAVAAGGGRFVTLSDHAMEARSDLRVNGPLMADFSTSLARASRLQGGLSRSMRAVLRWTSLLAWDARGIRVRVEVPGVDLASGSSLQRVARPKRGVGHLVLDALAEHIGPSDHGSWLRRSELAEPLVELLAMSPTAVVRFGSSLEVCLDLPFLADEQLEDVFSMVERLVAAVRRAPSG